MYNKTTWVLIAWIVLHSLYWIKRFDKPVHKWKTVYKISSVDFQGIKGPCIVLTTYHYSKLQVLHREICELRDDGGMIYRHALFTVSYWKL